jgi:subfamily B ATP-binding cassette protein HlyB/CyaB
LQQDAQADTGPDDRNPDTGILCLAMVLLFQKRAADPSQLAHEFAPANGTTNLLGLVRAAKQMGLKARSGELKIKRL